MPARLTSDRFAAAQAFMHAQADPLELALWRLSFEGGERQPVLDALAPFQNPDGGFGHGLEPDLSTPASSAIATSVGLRHLRRAGAPAAHPMVAGALRWLAANIEDGVWPIIDARVDDAPHAPWWAYDSDLAQRWQGFRFNPTAEILAHLYHFRDGAPADLIAAAEARMRRTVGEFALIDGAYDLRCAALLAEAPGVPQDLREALSALLLRSVVRHDAADEHAPALDLAPRPDSLLAGPLKDQLEPAAAALVDGQTADGGWSPFWDWGFVDEAAWAKAKKTWRGSLTRLAVEALAAHGRVDR
ncbi:hypothetical protein ACO2Q3_07065 [Caulobacter sp. KR2-114]|uniref:hypothetical protein n=1 Tax=Caulobacter sp. KR2-114 TaxID=3400912 RepID=UPI003BFDED8A